MIKSKRKEKGLTELELAEKIGISKSYINRIENHPSACNVSVKIILKLSTILEIEPEKVFLYFINNK